jgi:hypothetical protein
VNKWIGWIVAGAIALWAIFKEQILKIIVKPGNVTPGPTKQDVTDTMTRDELDAYIKQQRAKK